MWSLDYEEVPIGDVNVKSTTLNDDKTSNDDYGDVDSDDNSSTAELQR